MNKPVIAISCPVDTYSGYGARARDFVKALINIDQYEVQILSQRWGNTRFGYLEDHNEHELSSRIVPALSNKPDIWIQVTVPNEFQQIGKFNIGLTAGMETTLVDPSWIQGCNKMDLILTSSQHSKETFLKSVYEMKDDKTGQNKGTLKLEKPIEVLLEGVDLDKYLPSKGTLDLSIIKESFCYLNVGHWMHGDIGEDRKNMGYLVKTFLETFKNKRNAPALILKTLKVGSSILDREAILDQIDNIRRKVKGTLPNIYLFHGEISDKEVNELYNHPKVKAMVSFTKGEGFGRPLAEFALTKKPIIASGWSGHLDFLKPEMSVLIGGELKNVHKSAAVKNMILPESKWFQPNDTQAVKALKLVYKDYKSLTINAKRQAAYIRENFSFKNMQDTLEGILKQYVPTMPKQMELKLPKLKKDSKPEITLPKLKKL